jgi:L-threonylcarbamoyladenylate synthase
VNTLVGKDIQRAADYLLQGEVVAIPTETVYGLAALAEDEQAVFRIFAIKGRDANKALPLQVAGIQQMKPLVKHIPDAIMRLLQTFWPGPLTVLLEKTDAISDTVTAGSAYAAFRIPNHPMALELLQLIGKPLAVTSANLSGGQSLFSAEDVFKLLKGKIPYVLDGGTCKLKKESTIVGYNDGKIELIREGTVGKEEVFRIADCGLRIGDSLGTL